MDQVDLTKKNVLQLREIARALNIKSVTKYKKDELITLIMNINHQDAEQPEEQEDQANGNQVGEPTTTQSETKPKYPKLKDSIEAVSYTHLDVYKRQGTGRGREGMPANGR